MSSDGSSNSTKNENRRAYSVIRDDNNNNNNNYVNNRIASLERKISLSKGQKEVDLVIRNTKIVNVFSGEIHQSDVAIADGIFVGFEGSYDAKKLFDSGKYAECIEACAKAIDASRFDEDACLLKIRAELMKLL